MSGAGSKRCGLIRSRRGKKSEPEPRDIMPTADGAERDEPRERSVTSPAARRTPR